MKRRHLHNIMLFLTIFHARISALELYRYFRAAYSHYRNDTPTAHNWYAKLLEGKMPLHAYKGYIELLFSQKKYPEVVHLMPQIKTVLNSNPDLQHMCAHALARTGKIHQADELLIRAAQQHKAHQEIVFYAAQTYLRRKEPENALRLIDTLLNSTPRMPSHYAFYFLKSHIYTSLNQVQNAIDSLKKCIALNPNFHKAKFMLALLSNKHTGHTQTARSAVYTLQSLVNNGKYTHAFAYLKKIITQEPTNQLWYEYLYQLSKQLELPHVIAFLRTYDNPWAHAYLGLLYFQDNQLAQALKYAHTAFQHSQDVKLKGRLALLQARIYHKQKKYAPMVAILEEGYQYDKHYAPLLNMLAYSYAKQERNLDTAMNLIEEVLKKNPTNPSYRDTKAMILYAQGAYKEAQYILESVIQHLPKDATIISHLSKVYKKQGISPLLSNTQKK